MEFKRFQYLRDKTIEKLKAGEVGPIADIDHYDALALAYLGDSYYSTYVRGAIMETGISKVRVLHEIVTRVISAKGQAQAYARLEKEFSEEERQIAKRGRNANVNVPKSAEVWEYRYSTALEALFGYLYLKGNLERLKELSYKAMMISLEGSK